MSTLLSNAKLSEPKVSRVQARTHEQANNGLDAHKNVHRHQMPLKGLSDTPLLIDGKERTFDLGTGALGGLDWFHRGETGGRFEHALIIKPSGAAQVCLVKLLSNVDFPSKNREGDLELQLSPHISWRSVCSSCHSSSPLNFWKTHLYYPCQPDASSSRGLQRRDDWKAALQQMCSALNCDLFPPMTVDHTLLRLALAVWSSKGKNSSLGCDLKCCASVLLRSQLSKKASRFPKLHAKINCLHLYISLPCEAKQKLFSCSA